MANGGKVVVKIDGDEKGLEKAFQRVKGIGTSAVKAAAAGVTAAAGAVGAVGTAAVKAYSDFEQLVGGVDTLFKESSSTVQRYADEAYKTAGMSANEYMETVTGFSASLLQSLGGDTKKAAEYANSAVTDMSDNANKMGTSIQSIQNAYQGFAKQNYTMLDNLKLGYGGTKEEMQRLLEDAQKISGIKYDISSFADITQAIHVIQNEMNITGTTAAEAATTIQGSLGMVKGAWENLLTGLADPDANVDVLFKNLMTSIETLGANLLPVIERVLGSLAGIIEEKAPLLKEKLPAIAEKILPALLSAAVDLTAAFAQALPGTLKVIGDTVLNAVDELGDSLADKFPALSAVFDNLVPVVGALAAAFTALKAEMLIASSVSAIVKTWNAYKKANEGATVAQWLLNAAMNANPVGIVIAAIAALTAAIVLLWKKNEDFRNFIISLCDSVKSKAESVVNALCGFFTKTLPESFNALKQKIKTKLSEIVSFFTLLPNKMKKAGKDLIAGLWNGIADKVEWLKGKVKGVVNKIKSWFTGKDGFDEHSPSKWSEKVFSYLVDGGVTGLEKSKNRLINSAAALVTDTRTEVQRVTDEMNKQLLESEKKYNAESERLKKSKSEKDKIYLDKLKETAEAERKIYDARQKDIESAKNNIIAMCKEMVSGAYGSVDELKKLEQSMSDKLKSYGSLSASITYDTEDGKSESLTVLADLSKQTEALQNYEKALSRVKERGQLPNGFFDILRGMSVEEGTSFANALLNVSDSDFEKFLSDWREKQETAERISRELYSEESDELAKTLSAAFDKTPEDFFDLGEESIKQFGEGFMSKLSELMQQVRDEIAAAVSDVLPSEYTAGGTVYTDNSKIVVQAADKSERGIIEAAQQAKTYNKHTSGWRSTYSWG